MDYDNQLILLCGLPGAGKTTLSEQIIRYRPDIEWINADEVRKKADDWDFSPAGRLRQTLRMRDAARNSYSKTVLVDQVCPTVELRKIMAPDRMIWMNTITREKSRYYDTSQVFEDPTEAEVGAKFFLELRSYVPNDCVKDLIDSFRPAYRVSGSAWGEHMREREIERQELLKLLNPEGIEGEADL